MRVPTLEKVIARKGGQKQGQIRRFMDDIVNILDHEWKGAETGGSQRTGFRFSMSRPQGLEPPQ